MYLYYFQYIYTQKNTKLYYNQRHFRWTQYYHVELIKKIQRKYQSSYSEVHFYRDKNVKINLGRSVMEHNRYYQSTKLNQVRFNPNISSYHPTKHITCSIMAIKCAKTFATGFNVMKGWSLFSNYNTMKSQLQDPLFICGKRRNQSSNFVAKLTVSSELIYDENMTIV